MIEIHVSETSTLALKLGIGTQVKFLSQLLNFILFVLVCYTESLIQSFLIIGTLETCSTVMT